MTARSRSEVKKFILAGFFLESIWGAGEISGDVKDKETTLFRPIAHASAKAA